MITENDELAGLLEPVAELAQLAGEKILAETLKAGDYTTIVVDDGSSDDSFVQAAVRGTLALRHRINRGRHRCRRGQRSRIGRGHLAQGGDQGGQQLGRGHL